MKYSKYSAVIVGSGIAGLFCALKLAQAGVRVEQDARDEKLGYK